MEPELARGKTEDTVVFNNGGLEVLTHTPRLPARRSKLQGKGYIVPRGYWLSDEDAHNRK